MDIRKKDKNVTVAERYGGGMFWQFCNGILLW
jgi:hypothetical protein